MTEFMPDFKDLRNQEWDRMRAEAAAASRIQPKPQKIDKAALIKRAESEVRAQGLELAQRLAEAGVVPPNFLVLRTIKHLRPSLIRRDYRRKLYEGGQMGAWCLTSIRLAGQEGMAEPGGRAGAITGAALSEEGGIYVYNESKPGYDMRTGRTGLILGCTENEQKPLLELAQISPQGNYIDEPPIATYGHTRPTPGHGIIAAFARLSLQI